MTYPIAKRVSIIAWPSALAFPVGTAWAITIAVVLFACVCIQGFLKR